MSPGLLSVVKMLFEAVSPRETYIVSNPAIQKAGSLFKVVSYVSGSWGQCPKRDPRDLHLLQPWHPGGCCRQWGIARGGGGGGPRLVFWKVKLRDSGCPKRNLHRLQPRHPGGWLPHSPSHRVCQPSWRPAAARSAASTSAPFCLGSRLPLSALSTACWAKACLSCVSLASKPAMLSLTLYHCREHITIPAM